MNWFRDLAYVVLMTLGAGCGGAASSTDAAVPRCIPGTSIACACPSGTGAQVCAAGGTYAACSCTTGATDAGLDVPEVADSSATTDMGFDAPTVLDVPPAPLDTPQSAPDVRPMDTGSLLDVQPLDAGNLPDVQPAIVDTGPADTMPDVECFRSSLPCNVVLTEELCMSPGLVCVPSIAVGEVCCAPCGHSGQPCCADGCCTSGCPDECTDGCHDGSTCVGNAGTGNASCTFTLPDGGSPCGRCGQPCCGDDGGAVCNDGSTCLRTLTNAICLRVGASC